MNLTLWKEVAFVYMFFACLLWFGCGGEDEEETIKPEGKNGQEVAEVGKSRGKIAFVSDRDGNDEIYVMDPDGSNLINLTNTPDEHEHSPAWSPDGEQIAFSSKEAIYAMNADGTNKRKLFGMADDPAWSSDGTKIAFATKHAIYVMNADGQNSKRIFDSNDARDRFFEVSSPTWSPDGAKIAFEYQYTIARDIGGRFDTRTFFNIYVGDADGNGNWTALFDEFQAADPSWSPDGKKIVFTKRSPLIEARQPTSEIWLMNPDGSGTVSLTPRGDGLWLDLAPSWSPDGKEIVFYSTRDGNSEIYTIAYDEVNPLAATPVRLTFHGASDSRPAWGL